MSPSPDLPPGAPGTGPGGNPAGEVVPAPARRPNLAGDIDAMLLSTPAFGRRPVGYDRLQVDNYVAWAEAELQAVRREADDLMERYSRCWAELELARQLLVHSPAGQRMSQLSERIGSMLQLAADEAAEITTTATAEAERVRSEARADADAWLRKAHEVKEMACAEADRLRQAAEEDRAEAVAVREQALADVAEQTAQAAAERWRLDEEAAQTRARLDAEAAALREDLDREADERRRAERADAAALIRRLDQAAREEREAADATAREQLAQLEAQIAELDRRREIAHASLLRMSDQVTDAVSALAAALPETGLRLVPRQEQNVS